MGILKSIHRTAILGALGSAQFFTRGQIVTDGTLGPKQSFNQNYAFIRDTVGVTREGNLFHSFNQFNVNAGQTVEFTGPSTIERVLVRVTGGEVSRIEGTLKSSISGADFFLLNPSGILFGDHAVVDVSGSFTATTADTVKMADGSRFYARPGAADEILSVAPPAAFGFLDPGLSGNGEIRFKSGSTDIAVEGGADLVAKQIVFEERALVSIPYGDVRMVAVGGAAELPIAALTEGKLPTGGDIEFNSGSQLNVGVDGVATLQMEAGSLTMIYDPSSRFGRPSIQLEINESTSVNENRIRLQENLVVQSGSIAVESNGEDPAIPLHIVANDITLQNASIQSINASEGPGADILIEADSLTSEFHGQIGTLAMAEGKAGDIHIDADNILLDDTWITSSYLGEDILSAGAGGSISIFGKTLTLKSGVISAETGVLSGGGGVTLNAETIRIGGGDGFTQVTTMSSAFDLESGVITVPIADILIQGTTIELLANSQLSSSSDVGASGSILLKGKNIVIKDRAKLESSSWGQSDGGNITVDGSDSVRIVDATLSSSAETDGSVDSRGGRILITSKAEIEIGGFSQISSESYGYSAAGSISIQAPLIRVEADTLNEKSPSISTDVFPVLDAGEAPSTASGGNIEFIADEIRFKGVFISAEVYEAGVGGNIVLKAPVIRLKDSSISVESERSGQSGSISIEGQEVSMEGGWVSADTNENPRGGNVTFKVSELDLSGGAMITSTVSGDQVAGAESSLITIHADRIQMQKGTSIEASTEGNARGGDLEISADEIWMDGASISAGSSSVGRSGSIGITTGKLSLQNSSSIDTDSWDVGEGGTIVIHGDTVRIGSGSWVSAEALGPGKEGQVAGAIHIFADQFELMDGGFVSAITHGKSDGGDVNVKADAIQISGASTEISAESFPIGIGTLASGTAGNIDLMAKTISVSDGATVVSSSRLSNAGSVHVAADNLLMASTGTFVVDANKGDAGNVRLSSGSILLLRDSEIRARAGHNGGGVELTSLAVGLEGSDLLADAVEGDGGRITITSDLYFTRDAISIEFDSLNDGARTGTFTLNSSLDLLGSLQPLSVELVEDSARIRDGCSRRNPKANTLLVRGKGGVGSGVGGVVSAVSLWNP